jgi:hypothetical protein
MTASSAKGPLRRWVLLKHSTLHGSLPFVSGSMPANLLASMPTPSLSVQYQRAHHRGVDSCAHLRPRILTTRSAQRPKKALRCVLFLAVKTFATSPMNTRRPASEFDDFSSSPFEILVSNEAIASGAVTTGLSIPLLKVGNPQSSHRPEGDERQKQVSRIR